MGESTIQATSQPSDQPPSPPAKKKWHVSTWIAVASAGAAIIAAAISAAQLGIARSQVDVASKQAAEAELDQLRTIATHIEEVFAKEQTAFNAITGRLKIQAVSSAEQAELVIDGQVGAALIRTVHAGAVASVEDIEIGRALAASGHIVAATKYYKAAVSASSPYDPITASTALRYLGILYYALDLPSKGHYTMMWAASAFRGHEQQQTRSYAANTSAEAYLLDGLYQMYYVNNCYLATRDEAAARLALGNSIPADATVSYLMKRYNADSTSYCSGSK